MTVGAVEFKPPVNEMTKSLVSLGPDLQYKGMRSAVVAYAAPIKAAMKGMIRSRSGMLKRSIGHKTVSKTDKITLGYKSESVVIAVGAVRKVAAPGKLLGVSQVKKMQWLDEGVKPHDIPRKRGIRRRSKKMKIGGRFVSSVEHPGTRPQNILDRSVSTSRSASQERFNRKLAQFLDKHK